MSKQMMLVVGIIIVLAVVGLLVFSMRNNNSQPAPQPTSGSETNGSTSTAPASDNAMTAQSPAAAGPVKEFTVSASNFKFTPSTLTVNKGDSVKITFMDVQGGHNLTFPDFNVETQTLTAGASQTLTFTADKTGSFPYFCSVGNHKAMGMLGTLTVQ